MVGKKYINRLEEEILKFTNFTFLKACILNSEASGKEKDWKYTLQLAVKDRIFILYS